MILPELWFDLPLAVFDLETTGFDAETNRIIEVGVVHFYKGQVQDSFNWLIDPECKIPEEIVKITGITQADVEGKPKFHEMVLQLMDVLKDRGLVAYNLPFDRKFLTQNFERLGYHWFSNQPSFDPLIYAHHIFPNQSNKLGNVAQRLGVTLEGAHRACNDAEATGKVMYAMRDHLPPALQDLLVIQAQWELQQRDAFAKRKNDKRQNNEFSSILAQSSSSDAKLGPAYSYGTQPDPLLAYYASLTNTKFPST